jgi:hypothetical protein
MMFEAVPTQRAGKTQEALALTLGRSTLRHYKEAGQAEGGRYCGVGGKKAA